MEDIAAARSLAEWLTEKGHPAMAMVPDLVAAPGDSLGLSPETFTGYEVRVLKEADAEPARQALDDLKDEVAARMDKLKKRSERTGTVKAVCEECGKESEWPAASMGTTEVCPNCDAYMDVPDPDDDEWGDVDFGEKEADNDAEGA
jgi:hypothetical protein